MPKIILIFVVFMITISLVASHMDFFWHQYDIVVVEHDNQTHDLGAGRFWFGFSTGEIYVRTDAGVMNHYHNIKSVTIRNEATEPQP